MKRLAACVLLIALPAAAGDFFRKSPLDGMDVVLFEILNCNVDPSCDDCAHWVAEWDAGQGWTPIPFSSQLVADDGIAYTTGVNLPMRACCVCNEGHKCTVERVCEVVERLPVRAPAPHIYSVTGGAFKPEDVAKWNAKAVMVEPTPAPGPPLGACCLDPAKWWVCGPAIQNTCEVTLGGWRWVEGAECSDAVCQP